jgi:beta-lactamase superfamily II metal-dependent hydrolase
MNKVLSIFFAGILIYKYCVAQTIVVGQPMPAWQKGYLDLHHINTGRGSAAYYVFPDGTTMLLDAGELSPLDPRTFTARNSPITPDSTKKPYEWIVNYIRQVAPPSNNLSIDYGLITHFHDDHFGAWYPAAPLSTSGKFLLTGITGVADLLPIHTLIDRGYPDYNYPYDIKKSAKQYGGGEIEFGHTMNNYFEFTREKQAKGMQMASLKAGSHKQFRLLYDAKAFPSFFVQNVKANQWIWTGKDSAVIQHFPAIDIANRKTWPDENSLSLALTINYGSFTYYTGGDNPGNVFTGDNPLRDVETPIAKAVGKVDIATMDHHGNRDAVNEYMVKTLQPTVWIGQTWSSDHPGHEVLARVTNKNIYSADRDLFATNMLEANRLVIGSLIDRSYKSQQGHIVIRVMPGGSSYYVIVLDDSKASMPVKAVFGPYTSQSNKVVIKATN